MKNINYSPIVLFLFFVSLIGCQGKASVDNLLDPELKKEILEFRKMVANDLQKENSVQEDFVKQRISSMESSSTLVEITVADGDTSVVICIFDTNPESPTATFISSSSAANLRARSSSPSRRWRRCGAQGSRGRALSSR